MQVDLSGKQAVICGGSRGIGRAIALSCAEAGDPASTMNIANRISTMMVLRSRIEKSVERVAHQLRRSHQTTIPAISSNSGRRSTANANTIEN